MKTHLATFVILIALFLTVLPARSEERIPGEGGTMPAIEYSYFPSRMHAFVWRNWTVVPQTRLAQVLGTTPQRVERVARSMGLPKQQVIQPEWATSRGYITVLRRNWHLLPYDQLTTLLGISRKELAWRLIEDDFLFVKLGNVKPLCEPLVYSEPTPEMNRRAAEIATEIKPIRKSAFGKETPRFDFVNEFQTPDKGYTPVSVADKESGFDLRMIFSYFADYGDPLLDPELISYPEGLLQRLSAAGVNGIWLHSVLRMMVLPSGAFPGDENAPRRIEGLKRLVERADKYGIKIYLYMNEPRAMSSSFFRADAQRGNWTGAAEGDLQAMCVSNPEVRQWLSGSLTALFSQVKGLGGVFTITASENFTTCVSHGLHGSCDRCKNQSYAALIVDVNRAITEGVQAGDPDAKVLVWDWGWRDVEAEAIIKQLPKSCWLMSVSEWSMPIERGGIASNVGEYSLSSVGPGPRSLRHWKWAKEAGLKTVAKVQVNASWEMSAVPAVPVLDLVAQHAENLSSQSTDGVMLSWSVGGYPSTNLNLFQRYKAGCKEQVMNQLAADVYGESAVEHVRKAWKFCSDSFKEYPYHIQTLYNGPQHMGPANPLYVKPTGYGATMVGLPYDNVKAWCSVYPVATWASQMEQAASGFEAGSEAFAAAARSAKPRFAKALHTEWLRSRVVRLHLLSSAQQARFTDARNRWLESADRNAIDEMKQAIEKEKAYVTELLPLVKEDSTVGYESSNHYFYLPIDLVEKYISILSAQRWLETL